MFTDIGALLRDTVLVALGAGGDLINEELRADIEVLAERLEAEGVLARLDQLARAREQLFRNVGAQLVLESLMAGFVLDQLTRTAHGVRA